MLNLELPLVWHLMHATCYHATYDVTKCHIISQKGIFPQPSEAKHNKLELCRRCRTVYKYVDLYFNNMECCPSYEVSPAFSLFSRFQYLYFLDF